MSRSPVSRRYAQALLELADQSGAHDAFRAAFDQLASVLREVPEASLMLSNPTVAQAKRRGLLEDMLKQLGLEGAVANMARLLLDKGRFSVALDVHGHFCDMLDARSGRVTAYVSSATALSPAQTEQLTQALSKRLAKRVVVEATIDTQLIGGLVVRVGNKIYDASISNHLNRLRDQLSASHVG